MPTRYQPPWLSPSGAGMMLTKAMRIAAIVMPPIFLLISLPSSGDQLARLARQLKAMTTEFRLEYLIYRLGEHERAAEDDRQDGGEAGYGLPDDEAGDGYTCFLS